MSNRIRSFRELDVWQSGMDLVVVTYELATKLPVEERFVLAAQMRRAAVSIPSNVAEGHAFRNQPKVYRRHVRIALGTLAELETQIEVAARMKFSDAPTLERVQNHLTRTGQLLHGLLRALRAIKEDRTRDR